MKKRIITYILIVVVVCSCGKEQKVNEDYTPQGEPINLIALSVSDVSETRIGVDIDNSQIKDKYFWKAGDKIVLCEINGGGTAFTGNNYDYNMNYVPTVNGDPAFFSGSGALTGGSYIVVHTRNWSNVVLPTSGTPLTCKLPTLTQSAPLTAANTAAVNAFADNLIFATTKIWGSALVTGTGRLNHIFTQIDVAITGQPESNGSRINTVELSPSTPNAFAQSVSINVNGLLTTTGNGVSKTEITDPNAKIDDTTPYTVRMLAIPTATASKADIKVYKSSIYYSTVQTTTARKLTLGEIVMLPQNIGTLNTSILLTPMTAIPYVGAFWKADQTGERLIRIDTQSADDIGDWTASVALLEGNWTNGDIVLSTTNLPTYPAGFMPTGSDTPSVTGGSNKVSGTSAAGTPIYFKIGLNSQYTAANGYDTNSAPARYAVILLSYNNNSKSHFIYLRQGEDADAINSTTIKWSVYNSQPTSYANTIAAQAPIIAVNYPTQAGGYKQFNDATGFYSPSDPLTPSIWDTSITATSIGTDANTCPVGYKVPTGGTADNGEMGSLLQPNVISIWGYYADGYFDRGQIGLSAANNGNSTVGSDNDVAYIGRLFINPTNNSSLFFPAAGTRFYGDGSLASNIGTTGVYRSSVITGSPNSYYFSISNSKVEQNVSARSNGLSIRCIRQ